MTRIWLLCVLVTAGMVAVLGCDDDDGGAVSSGINSSKQLDGLSEAEGQKLCEEFLSEMTKLLDKEALCKIAGISAAEIAAGSVQVCHSTYDGCMKTDRADTMLDEMLDELASCDSEDFSDDGEEGECNATVGEMEKCANDMLAVYESSLDELSCENFQTFEEPEEPASCQVVEEKCPGVMEDGEFDDFEDF